MVYCGQAAIDYLASQISAEEPGASSHWRLHHRDFTVQKDGSFAGLSGFGGAGRPYKGLRALAHKTLQRKFRHIARENPAFDRIDSIAMEVTVSQSRAYSLDMLRQSLTLAFLERHVSRLGCEATVGVIGDGFASMSTLLVASGLAKRVVLVNLNKTLLVDLAYFHRWARGKEDVQFRLVMDASGMAEALNDNETCLIAIQASNHTLLGQAPLDLAINIASMQEMEPTVIAHYFDDLRTAAKKKQLLFYCCNREEKRLPDGVVTKFSEYPWESSDKILVDELCPWHQQYYSAYPPFYRNYDGRTRHRLARLN